MKISDETIKTYFNKNEKYINCSADEFKLINLLEENFKKTNNKLFEECERLIIHICAKTKYNAFVAGFKQGIKYKRSLNK